MLSKSKKVLIILGLFLFFFLLINLIGVGRELGSKFDSSNAWFDRHGELLRIDLSSDDKFRVRADLSDYPPEFVKLITFQEDRWFWWHYGVNPISIFRALFQTYFVKSRRIGGSTITMQTHRLISNYSSSGFGGKIRQIFGSISVELLYSKKEVLLSYLNLVPCGANIEGFYSASLYYFGRELSDLSLHEMMMLAVIPQDPNNRNPLINDNSTEIKEAIRRLNQKWIKKQPKQRDRVKFLNFVPPVLTSRERVASHFIDTLSSENRSISTSRIITTLDLKMQKSIESTIKNYLAPLKMYGVKNATVVVVDNRNSELVSVVGSADYYNDEISGQVDGSVALRSPGSTLKPFIYALAIEQGHIHNKSVLRDAPTSFGDYTPDNFKSNFSGVGHADKLLVDSRNIPAIELANKLKNPDLYDLLVKSGSDLQQRGHYGLSLVLGSAEVSLRELVTMYSSLSRGGVQHPLKQVFDNLDDGNQVSLLSPESAWVTREMLYSSVPPKGYNLKDVAFKTGTSVGFRDCWSIGIVDQYSVGVWVGNFTGEGNSRFVGRLTAAPLLFEVAKTLRNRGDIQEVDRKNPFELDKLKKVEVCKLSGMIRGKQCLNKIDAWFIPGVSPIKKCDVHRAVYIDKKSGFRLEVPTSDSLLRVYEFWPSEVYSLFNEAGTPRARPPEFLSNLNYLNLGSPPRVIFPVRKIRYIIQYSKEDSISMLFQASADGDTKLLYWYLNEEFIQTSLPEEKFEKQIKEGNYRVVCVDQKGRCAVKDFIVAAVP